MIAFSWRQFRTQALIGAAGLVVLMIGIRKRHVESIDAEVVVDDTAVELAA